MRGGNDEKPVENASSSTAAAVSPKARQAESSGVVKAPVEETKTDAQVDGASTDPPKAVVAPMSIASTAKRRRVDKKTDSEEKVPFTNNGEREEDINSELLAV